MVSIVITTYNRAKILEERSLRSALNQIFKDYEIIVVDDAGTDNTEEIVKKYPVRNYGIEMSKGKYIVCLDDDNELMPDFLAKTLSQIGGYDAITTGRVIQYKDFADKVIPKLSKFCPIDWGWLVRREVFNEIQYDEQMRANEDTDFGIQFHKKFKAKVIPDLL